MKGVFQALGSARLAISTYSCAQWARGAGAMHYSVSAAQCLRNDVGNLSSFMYTVQRQTF